MGHGSRHRRSDAGRSRHERQAGDQQVALSTVPQRRGGARTGKIIGAGLAVSLAVGVAAVVAGAADGSAAPTSLTVGASADTYVYQEYPNENRGSAPKLTASDQKNLHTRAYFRFSVRGVPGGATPKAHLLLSSDRNQPGTVELHSVASTDWNAMTMTMRTAPAVGATVATARPAARQKSLDFDLSGVVTRDGTYSFALVAPLADTVSAVFASEHGADGPQLVLNWDGQAGAPAPAPPTSAPTLPGLPSMSPLPPAPSRPKPTGSATSSAPAPPAPPAPPTKPVGSTLFGTSLWTGDGSNASSALARETAAFGRPDVVRTYYSGMPAAWPGSAGVSGGPVVVSFKAAPRDVAAGRLDSQFANWFATAPKDRPIFWSYFHEPENDVESGSFTTADYRAAWTRLAGLADKANNPQLHSNLILMCWTLNPGSHRNWKDYFAGSGAIDTIGWDCYNKSFSKGSYGDPASMLGTAVATSKSAGVNWAVAELGSKMAAGDSGGGRAAWLTKIGSYARANGAAYITYFDSTVGGDFRLLDAASKNAWRQVIAG